MTDRPDNAGPSGPGSPLGAAARTKAALGAAALRHRVRTITGGRVELDPGDAGRSVLGAVVDDTAYVQTADRRGLGPALRWALANGAERLWLIAEAEVAADLARRAALLEAEITVWSARGTEVERAKPGPVTEPPRIPDHHHRYRALISEAGARPVDDHGMLVAEVAGLEVARVVDADPTDGDPAHGDPAGGDPADRDPADGDPADGDPTDGDPTDGDPVSAGRARLVVGVGQADRELQQYLHRHLDDDANLRRAIAAVDRHRRPGSASHPLSRLARQRWLRSVLLDDPSLLGVGSLEPVPPLRPRQTVLGDEPAAAAGRSTVVVCSVGVDLDLLPEAVDYRCRIDPQAELVVVVPERDRLLATGPVAALVPRLRVVSIPVPWGG